MSYEQLNKILGMTVTSRLATVAAAFKRRLLKPWGAHGAAQCGMVDAKAET